MTAGSCPPPGLNRTLPGSQPASLAAGRLHPNQCAVHWPITCPKQQQRGLGGFCAHSWGRAPSVQAPRSRSREMMPRGSLVLVDALFFSSNGTGIRVEHGETMESCAQGSGEGLTVRLKTRTRGGLAYR